MLAASTTKMGIRAATGTRRSIIPAIGRRVSRKTVDFAPSCPLPRRSRIVVSHATASAPQKTPSVKIDNIHDPFATLVTVDMGGIAGEMLETVSSIHRASASHLT